MQTKVAFPCFPFVCFFRAQVELCLSEDRQPLLAEQSALAVVTFVADRHRYSAEQLCNVLVAERFRCYCDEQNKVLL